MPSKPKLNADFDVASANAAEWQNWATRVADAVLGPMPSPLHELVAQVSHVYTRERGTLGKASTSDALQARLRFFFARDVQKLDAPLRELEYAGALPSAKTWRVLDLGAGVGTTTIGIAKAAARLGATLNVHAYDLSDRSLKIMDVLTRATGARVKTVKADVTKLLDRKGQISLEHGSAYDVIALGLFLNELPKKTRFTLVNALRSHLAPGGSLIILEPALKEPTRDLHDLRDRWLSTGWNVFAPCLHINACPMLASKRDWCHEDRVFRLPESLVPVAKKAGLRYERLTYTYLTLRRDSVTLKDALPAEMSRVVSQKLRSKGKSEIFVCGTSHARWVRLDRKRSEKNAAFDEVKRGDVVSASPLTSKGDGLRIELETEVQVLSPGIG